MTDTEQPFIDSQTFVLCRAYTVRSRPVFDLILRRTTHFEVGPSSSVIMRHLSCSVQVRGFVTQDSTNSRGRTLLPLLVLLVVSKPACELSNKSLLTIVQSQDGPRGPFLHVQCEHLGRG